MHQSTVNKQFFAPGQSGFSLLENMIALLVLSIGLLGIAGLQAFTLRTGSSSAQRLTAIEQAYSMADRIRANVNAVYPPAGNKTVVYANITPQTTPTLAVDCRVAVCTPQQLADFDVWEWYQNNELLLPGTTGYRGGYITRSNLVDATGSDILLYPGTAVSPGPVRARFTIVVRWDGDRTGATGLNCPPLSSADMSCFTLEVDL